MQLSEILIDMYSKITTMKANGITSADASEVNLGSEAVEVDLGAQSTDANDLLPYGYYNPLS